MRYEVNIPEGVSGDYRVVHQSETTILEQNINGEWLIIMEDSELEAEQADQFLQSASGDVLIAGLGLGVNIQPLIDNPNVNSVTIIEKHQEVIDLVWNNTPQSNKINLIKADIYTWNPDKNYDVAWFDSFINPIDGADPKGDYKTAMTDKYQNNVSAGYFWPDTRGW